MEGEKEVIQEVQRKLRERKVNKSIEKSKRDDRWEEREKTGRENVVVTD